tara:strand:- start:337 stop:567 length:231 start_codon:yes stop_codon:yes gene_type:complete
MRPNNNAPERKKGKNRSKRKESFWGRIFLLLRLWTLVTKMRLFFVVVFPFFLFSKIPKNNLKWKCLALFFLTSSNA